MKIGTAAKIWRYPTKSLRGEGLESAVVQTDGLAGDRTRALIVEAGTVRVGKTYRGKEHNRLHLLDDADAAVAAARDHGTHLRVANDAARYFDAAPVSIIVDRWLEELASFLGFPLEPQRFRPNFFVHAHAGFAAGEAALTGREVQLGEVRLRVRKPIVRCVTPTYDLQTGESNPEILRTLVDERSKWMGIYCDVLRAGTVRIGDSLTLAE